MNVKQYVRYLGIPALALLVVGVLLMVIRPNQQGVVFGGLAFTIGVVLLSIGEISRKPRPRMA